MIEPNTNTRTPTILDWTKSEERRVKSEDRRAKRQSEIGREVVGCCGDRDFVFCCVCFIFSARSLRYPAEPNNATGFFYMIIICSVINTLTPERIKWKQQNGINRFFFHSKKYAPFNSLFFFWVCVPWAFISTTIFDCLLVSFDNEWMRFIWILWLLCEMMMIFLGWCWTLRPRLLNLSIQSVEATNKMKLLQITSIINTQSKLVEATLAISLWIQIHFFFSLSLHRFSLISFSHGTQADFKAIIYRSSFWTRSTNIPIWNLFTCHLTIQFNYNIQILNNL